VDSPENPPDKKRTPTQPREAATWVPAGFEDDVQELIRLAEETQWNPTAHDRRAELLEHLLSEVDAGQYPAFRAAILNDLGLAYASMTTGDRLHNLRSAIDFYRAALEYRTQESAPLAFARTQNNLGIAYASLPDADVDGSLQQAIECYHGALSVIDREVVPLDYAMTQNNLGLAYASLRTGDSSRNLQRAIECYRKALTVYTPEASPLDYAMTQDNLGIAFYSLPTGDHLSNLHRAINCHREALRFRSPDTAPLDYARTLNNLGVSLHALTDRNRAANLREAIECYKEALRHRTLQSTPLDYATTQSNLGLAYTDLPTGDRTENLQRAIVCFAKALTVSTIEDTPLDYAMTQNNLGRAYADMPGGDRATSLRRAVECYEKALAVYTVEATPFEYASTQINLGLAYTGLQSTDWPAYVHRAIKCYQEALRVFTLQEAPYRYAMVQTNLGSAYDDLASEDQAINLVQAIHCYHQALTVYSPEATPFEYASVQNDLGFTYARMLTGQRETNLQRAVDCYLKALRIRTTFLWPRESRQTSQNLGKLHFEERRWQAAHAAFKDAIAAEELLYEAAATEPSRQSELGEAADLFRNDAYCLARLGCFGESVGRVESSRARALTGALARNRAALQDVGTEDREAFHALTERIKALERKTRDLGATDPESLAQRFTDLSHRLGIARTEMAVVVGRIRAYVPDFMPASLDFESIAEVAAPDRPLVYLVTTSLGSVALLVPHDVGELTQDHVVWLDAFTQDTLDEILYGRGDQQGFLHRALKDDTRSLAASLENILPILGQGLMGPLADQLLHLGYDHCTLIPCGCLGLLPLHAACLPDGRYLDQAIEMSYAPCARVLQHVRQQIPEREVPTLFAVVDPPHRQEVSLGEITLPLSVPRLPYSHLEARAVGAVFPEGSADVVLCEGEATRSSTLAHIGGRSYLHFSCHGFFSPTEPLMSALMLAGEDRLTLADILNHLDLSGARLAVLSACQTAITEFQRVPDEAIGLPAGFLQAGVRGVIGSLWPVYDMSTTLLMGMFYRYHIQDGLTPAAALRRAQQWLGKSTAD